MRAFVFTNKALTADAGRYVWLSLNTEKAVNAPFLKRHPIPALPSYLVLDPDDESVALRWVGGASVAQFKKIFGD